MRHFSKVCLVSTFALFMSAVLPAACPGFLENYAQLRPGKYVEKYYFNNQALREKGYVILAVKEIDVTRIKNSSGLKPEEAANYLRRELQAAARQSQIERFFVFEWNDQTPVQAVLEVAITEQSSGDRLMRFIGPLLGLGQAYFRVEGRVRDLQSNHVIASFTDHKSSKAIWPLRDFGQDGGVVMLKEMYLNVSDEIIKEIGDSFGYLPETLKDGLPFKYH